MDEGVKRIISIQCRDEEERLKVGNSIHEQLVGNRDYFDLKNARTYQK